MSFASVLRSFASGVVVYLVVAACSSSSSTPGSGDGGASGADALANPVGDALAQPAGADVAEEACDKTVNTVVYAVHAFPGKSVTDLASLRVLLHIPADRGRPSIDGASFEQIAGAAYVRDGSAAVNCGTTSFQSYDRVTFILPR